MEKLIGYFRNYKDKILCGKCFDEFSRIYTHKLIGTELNNLITVKELYNDIV